jgi:hypothetical protein
MRSGRDPAAAQVDPGLWGKRAGLVVPELGSHRTYRRVRKGEEASGRWKGDLPPSPVRPDQVPRVLITLDITPSK